MLTPAGAVADAKLAQARVVGRAGDRDPRQLRRCAAARAGGGRDGYVVVNSATTPTGSRASGPRCTRSSSSSAARPTSSRCRTAAAATRRLPVGLRRGRRRRRGSCPGRRPSARRRSPPRSGSASRCTPPRSSEPSPHGAEVVTLADDEILGAWRDLARLEGVFCEPSSAAGAGRAARSSPAAPASTVVCVAHRARAEGHRAVDAARRPPPSTPTLEAVLEARRRPMTRLHVASRTGHDREPRLRLRLRRAGARPLERARGRAEASSPVGRSRARAPASCRDDAGESRGAGIRARSRPSTATASASSTGSRSSAGSVRARRRSRRARRRAAPSADGALSAAELLALGEPLDGHADNLAAAILGGACLTWREDGERRGAPDRARPAARSRSSSIPRTRTNTAHSRGGLPATVSATGRGGQRGRGGAARRGARDRRRRAVRVHSTTALHEPYRDRRGAAAAALRRPAAADARA